MSRSTARLLIVVVLLAGGHLAASPVQAAACDGSTDALVNGGFEDPGVAPGTFTLFPATSVPPWQTTDVADQIEIWGDGFNDVPAGEGASFAEINANSAGTLYQDVVTTPGETMHWTLLHRARIGTDVMAVLIGDATTADPTGPSGWDFTSPDLSDDTTAWGSHAGDYVVPTGQTCTRFAFRAVSSGAGAESFGNFLDAVAFSIPAPPTSAPTPAPTVRITEPPTDAAAIEAARTADPGWPAILLTLATAAGLAWSTMVIARRRGRR